MRVFITLLISIVAFGSGEVCVEYSGKDFILNQIIFDKDKEINKSLKLDYVKTYFFKEKGQYNLVTLEYSVNHHKRLYKYIYCSKQDDKLWCSIECDGGGFYVNKNFDIDIKTPLRVFADEEGGRDLPYLELAKIKKGYIKGKIFKCPKKLPKAKYLPNEKYYKDNPNGNYVCYDYKEDNRYYGCFRSIKSCKELHIQRFGKYGSKKAVKEALKRCKNSKPNRDYIDNPNGKYVCYDYIDNNGEYKGCFRAMKSCKLLHKKHFGRYLTKQESKNALARCQASLPKK